MRGVISTVAMETVAVMSDTVAMAGVDSCWRIPASLNLTVRPPV